MAGRSERIRPVRPTGRRRAVELCKDVLILVLACSAVYLAVRSQLYTGLGENWFSAVTHLLAGDGDAPPPAAGAAQPADAVRPVCVAFCTGVDLGNGARQRFAVQYDAAAVDSAFDETRAYLGEALAGAEAPENVSRSRWQEALQAPGIYFDLLGKVPLRSLASWLGEGGSGALLPGTARRLVLADRGEANAVLYYINEEDGLYYACDTSVPVSGEFTSLLSARGANGARFAFEAGEAFEGVAPYVLVQAGTPAPQAYSALNPVSLDDDGQIRLLQERLSFRPAGYSSWDGWVNDTLRIGRDGTVTYDARQGDDERYEVPLQDGRPDLTRAVDQALLLAEGAAAAAQGGSAARFYLIGIEEKEEGAWLSFGYVLDGIRVEVEGQAACARFLVAQGRIIYYEIKLRLYQASGESGASLLPGAQAAAIVRTRSYGGELALCYGDPGGGEARVSVDWAVRDS